MVSTRRSILVSLRLAGTSCRRVEVNWQELVARPARERMVAETCTGLLKKTATRRRRPASP
jgi:hypothetical protein